MVMQRINNKGTLNDLVSEKDPRGLVKEDVRYLEQVFKVRPITPKLTDKEIMFQAGQQSVIEHIKERLVK